MPVIPPNATITTRRQPGSHLLILGVTADSGPVSFVSGQFVNLALANEDGTLTARPYSIASAPGAAETEFALALVEGGALTPRLWELPQGARVYVETGGAGSFTLRDVPPHSPLLVVATGTGTAPFMSMKRAGLWANRKVTVVHGARTADGLAYQELLREDPAVHYLATVTRDAAWTGRTTRVQQVLEELAPTPDGTHAMLCGNPEMIAGVRAWVEARGFKKHRKRDPGNLHFEAYW